MKKEELDIPLTDEELKQRVLYLIKKNKESNHPIPEDSFIRLEIWDDITGMDYNKKVKDSEIIRLMKIYQSVISGE